MKVTLDAKTIQLINLFQNLTGCSVTDCLDDDSQIYFIVGEGQYGLSVGKNGSRIKNAERVFKKQIKVFEYSSDIQKFVQNMMPEAQDIVVINGILNVKIKSVNRAKIIGKNGSNIKIVSKFLKRLFDIDGVKLK